MNWNKLNPWNWFKHEDSIEDGHFVVPVKRESQMTESESHHPANQLQQEVDRFFDDIFTSFGFPSWDRRSGNRSRQLTNGSSSGVRKFMTFKPDVNVSNADDTYTITLEAAGLTDRDISIELVDDQLVIKGNKQEEFENRDEYFYRIERRYGQFQRVLDLPADAKPEEIKANMANGLLTIQLPRKEHQDKEVQHITIGHS